MPPMYKRGKYKNIVSLRSHPWYNYKTQKVQVFVTIKPDTPTIRQPQKVEFIILKW